MKTPSAETILITVSGKDAPGITSEMTRLLAESDCEVLDIGQAVLHGLLSLSILFKPAGTPASGVLRELEATAKNLGLQLHARTLPVSSPSEEGTDALAARRQPYAVTLIAERISASVLHEVTTLLVRHRLNIDAIQRLSERELSCVELSVSFPGETAAAGAPLDPIALRRELLDLSARGQVDIGFQAEGLYRRAKRLVVFDMDSTLIQNEVIDEFARERGVYERVAAITEEAMRGRLDFQESLTRRVRELQGLTLNEIENVAARLQLTPGAEELVRILKRLGYKTAIISGGFSVIADRFKARLGMDYAYANSLEMKDGAATGRVLPPIVDAQRKADLLEVIVQQEKIHLDQVIAVGDGANDLLMLDRAGLGIAFNAKPLVREKADLSLSQKSLQSILYLLGIPGRDLSEALKRG
jgi:phosphoserine phosphatase